MRFRDGAACGLVLGPLVAWWSLAAASDSRPVEAAASQSGAVPAPTLDASVAHGAACSSALQRLRDFRARLPPEINSQDGGNDAATNIGAGFPRGPRQPWAPIDPGRWQSAFTNYHRIVTPDRLRPLGSEALPFARFINQMHARIHPIFDGGFLASLEFRPTTDPLNDPNLHTSLEIVLDRTGRLVTIGIIRSSFVPAFDLSALQAVERAQPFGVPPVDILSADSNVYIHWDFYRDERCECSAFNVRPLLLF